MIGHSDSRKYSTSIANLVPRSLLSFLQPLQCGPTIAFDVLRFIIQQLKLTQALNWNQISSCWVGSHSLMGDINRQSCWHHNVQQIRDECCFEHTVGSGRSCEGGTGVHFKKPRLQLRVDEQIVSVTFEAMIVINHNVLACFE